MRMEVAGYIFQQPLLRQYLRENPQWYRKLSRDPARLQQFEICAMHYFKRTIPDQIEKFSNGVQMASMLLGLFQAMNNHD
ncbi:MAG: YlbE-like family protein [Bacillales bacterium]